MINFVHNDGTKKGFDYELLKKVTRGQTVSKDILHNLIKSLKIPETEKDKLLKLRPESYIGYAIDLCNDKK